MDGIGMQRRTVRRIMGVLCLTGVLTLPGMDVVGNGSRAGAQVTCGPNGNCLGNAMPELAYRAGDVFSDADCASCASGPSLPQLAVPNLIASTGDIWSAGVEFTFLKPHFSGSNVAFSTLTSDGSTFETLTDTDFAYDTDLAPRVWVQAAVGANLGFRATYWQFDHEASPAVANPPANGFGRISHPSFGDVDLSTTIPDTQFDANTALNAYAVDLEFTKAAQVGCSAMQLGVGLRYAEAEQNYAGQLQDAAAAVQGTIDFSHQINGIGPTVSLRSERPLTPRVLVFGLARGAVLFGEGESVLTAIEDQDLDTPFTTNRTIRRDDFLSIGELQVGLKWTSAMVGPVQPYLQVALEGQLWNGVGNASSVDGTLGFFGLNAAIGTNW